MDDQRVETLKHIEEVKKQIDIVVAALQDRAAKHDASKLESPEREIFDNTVQNNHCTHDKQNVRDDVY